MACLRVQHCWHGQVMSEDTADNHRTVLDWVCARFPDSSRNKVKDWIREGRVLLCGQVVKSAGMRIADPGEHLELAGKASENSTALQRKRIHPKLEIVFMDLDFAVADKEAGMLSVPRDEGDQGSVLCQIERYLRDPAGKSLRNKLFGAQHNLQPLPVHRLDQYTSGLMCVALNAESRSSLIEQLRAKTLLREYLAFTDGVPENESGTWVHSLKLDERGYQQTVGSAKDPEATQAVTHYRVEQVFPKQQICLLRLRLETGLKHQIRIQAAAVGIPLIGDRQYNPATRHVLSKGARNFPFGMQRQALHAATLAFQHPRTGKAVNFQAALPKDLQALLERLQ